MVRMGGCGQGSARCLGGTPRPCRAGQCEDSVPPEGEVVLHLPGAEAAHGLAGPAELLVTCRGEAAGQVGSALEEEEVWHAVEAHELQLEGRPEPAAEWWHRLPGEAPAPRPVIADRRGVVACASDGHGLERLGGEEQRELHHVNVPGSAFGRRDTEEDDGGPVQGNLLERGAVCVVDEVAHAQGHCLGKLPEDREEEAPPERLRELARRAFPHHQNRAAGTLGTPRRPCPACLDIERRLPHKRQEVCKVPGAVVALHLSIDALRVHRGRAALSGKDRPKQVVPHDDRLKVHGAPLQHVPCCCCVPPLHSSRGKAPIRVCEVHQEHGLVREHPDVHAHPEVR
mmetsp:Transcript_63150/g.203584  ORF Transcript_63150/g.203584 Transcript_63150/m.203584 type:complete len:342 (+) Transcript_63150:445-1470(+)